MKTVLKGSALLLTLGLLGACQATSQTRTEVYQQEMDGATLVFTFTIDEASDLVQEQDISLTLPYEVAGFKTAEEAKQAIELSEEELQEVPDGVVLTQDFQSKQVINRAKLDYSKLSKEDMEVALEKYTGQDINLADNKLDMSDLAPYLEGFEQVKSAG